MSPTPTGAVHSSQTLFPPSLSSTPQRRARREWHDKGLQHEGLRRRVLEYILTRLLSINATPSWYFPGTGIETPAVAARRLEAELYFSATSVAVFTDESTLEERLMRLAFPAVRAQPPTEILVPRIEAELVFAPTTLRCETPQRFNFTQYSGTLLQLSGRSGSSPCTLLDFTSPSIPSMSNQASYTDAYERPSPSGDMGSLMDDMNDTDDCPTRTPRAEPNPSTFLRSIQILTGKRQRTLIPLSPKAQGAFSLNKALFCSMSQDMRPEEQ